MTESAWKAAARHWWERMRQAERARDRWVEAAHRVGAENRLVFEERDELLQKLEELRAQPSGNPGDFAALAERIAYADGKHPRDLPDTSHEINAERVVSRLARARVELEAFPAWDNAFECEVAEASAEIALGNPERLADELLDVATVAMRWRRAVLERGKK